MATDGNFRFVSIQCPDGVEDRKNKRLARSHAIKHALERKRKAQQQSGLNFRLLSWSQDSSRATASTKTQLNRMIESPEVKCTGTAIDLIRILDSGSSRLQTCLSQSKTEHSAEPIFSIADELVLFNFIQVFRARPGDPALHNAAMLTFSLATNGALGIAGLNFQNKAINTISERMSCLDVATSESTLASIILLAGIEARLSMPVQVQLHMNAIQHLLGVCQSQGIHLTDAIKRAIFWQDLNSSVMTGSKRIVNHETFTELRWRRDPFAPNDFVLQPGFQRVLQHLNPEFIEILEDIHSLQNVRDSTYFESEDIMSMAQIDNHQASIQSRLVSIPSTSGFLECCNIAAYLCSTMLRCKIWRASVFPSQLSLKLLQKLQQESVNSIWDSHPDLLLWLIYIGGAFAPSGDVREQYLMLLNLHRASRFENRYDEWPEILTIMKQFIWSDKAFLSQVRGFWEEVYQTR
uniref:Transcription factor domain-containing protein n=1 Tax=Bionectria ochroleuca TaxID=29856 RepID=A0A8H7K2J7_BIOOC